jgi:large repetitive protein
MLSATVTAVLTGGNLTLTGNKNDAYVEVHETGTGSDAFLVTGLSGTKITYGNSTATSQTISGVTGSLTVNLPGTGSGTQSFELDSLSTSAETDVIGNLSITMGSANNTVTLQGPSLGIGGTASIVAGSGNQTINVGKVENMGGGPDVFVDGGPMSITCGAGNSSVTVVDTAVYEGSLCIALNNGNGNVVVGSEADDVGTDVLVGGSLTITTGNGNANVHVVNSDIEDNLVVKTGNGNANVCIGTLDIRPDNNLNTNVPEYILSGFDVSVSGYIYVSTCPGNATVTILDTTVGFEEIESDVRPAFVSQSSLNTGDVAIELGVGNDKVTIGTSTDPNPYDIDIEGNLYVDVGSGNETASIQSTYVGCNIELSHQAGNTTITLGAYDPYVYEEQPDVDDNGNLCITTSTGNALITIGGENQGDYVEIGGCTTITTGAGNATISLIGDEFNGNATITTGSGNTNLSILNDDFFSNLGVTLGVGGTSGGNSSVNIRNTYVADSTTLNGGGNASLYYDSSDDFNGGISYSHFKTVTT